MIPERVSPAGWSVTVEHGCREEKQPVPPGWVEVDTFHPCSSVVPWESYGGRRWREVAYVLTAAGIESKPLRTVHTRIAPRGSGPRGLVRFGDDMMPGQYRTAVAAADESRAREALAAHDKAVDDWAHHGGPYPDALRNS